MLQLSVDAVHVRRHPEKLGVALKSTTKDLVSLYEAKAGYLEHFLDKVDMTRDFVGRRRDG